MKGIVFITPIKRGHPWFVISDALQGEVLTVNITDAAFEDSTCILQPGDHACVIKPSAVRYRSAKAWRVQELQKNLALCYVHPDLASAELLKRIIDGGLKSEDLFGKFLKFLL